MNRSEYVNPTIADINALIVDDALVLTGYNELVTLPAGVVVDTVVLSECDKFESFPTDFKANVYVMGRTKNFTTFPPHITSDQIKILGVG